MLKFKEQPINPANPDTIPKFIDQLIKPPTAISRVNKNYPGTYYEIKMMKAKHQFHRNFP